MKYILNNDNLEVVGKQYLQGVGGYDGTNTTTAKSVQEVITEVQNKIENAGGGADWNAQEGEPGYIKNRTHYVTINPDLDKHIINDADLIEIANPEYPDQITVTFREIYGGRFAMQVLDKDTWQNRFKVLDVTDKFELVGQLPSNEDCCIYVKYDKNNNVLTLEFSCPIEIDVLDLKSRYFYFSYDSDIQINTLDDVYLPDTIARKDYVKTQIAGAITNTINANY